MGILIRACAGSLVAVCTLMTAACEDGRNGPVAPPEGYDILVSPAQLTFSRGGETTAQVSILRRNGFSGPVALEVVQPSATGVRVELDDSIAMGGTTLRVIAARSAQPGDLEFQLEADAVPGSTSLPVFVSIDADFDVAGSESFDPDAQPRTDSTTVEGQTVVYQVFDSLAVLEDDIILGAR